MLVMTTNHLKQLDPALVRPGRIDIVKEFGPLSRRDLSALFRLWFSRDADPQCLPDGVVVGARAVVASAG